MNHCRSHDSAINSSCVKHWCLWLCTWFVCRNIANCKAVLDMPGAACHIRRFALTSSCHFTQWLCAGTSPLYVIPAIFHEAPTEADVVGAVSLIIWTLSAILITKYALIVIRADDKWPGGRHAVV